MTTPVTIADLKAQAKALRAVLAERGISKSHTACLEEVARQRGFTNFRAAKAVATKAAAQAMDPATHDLYFKHTWIARCDPYLRLGLKPRPLPWYVGETFDIVEVGDVLNGSVQPSFIEFRSQERKELVIKLSPNIHQAGFAPILDDLSDEEIARKLNRYQVEALIYIDDCGPSMFDLERYCAEEGSSDILVVQGLAGHLNGHIGMTKRGYRIIDILEEIGRTKDYMIVDPWPGPKSLLEEIRSKYPDIYANLTSAQA